MELKSSSYTLESCILSTVWRYFQGKPESLNLIIKITTYIVITFAIPLPKKRIPKAEAYPMKVVTVKFRVRKTSRKVLWNHPQCLFDITQVIFCIPIFSILKEYRKNTKIRSFYFIHQLSLMLSQLNDLCFIRFPHDLNGAWGRSDPHQKICSENCRIS